VFEGAVTDTTLPLGQLNLTTEVENFPGFPDGVQGPELMIKMREQAERFGTRVFTRNIEEIDLSRRPFVMKDSDGETTEAHTVVIATGASANYLGLASEERFKNKGVSACAVCDGALPRYRNKPLIVVGGGDSACEEGLYLTKYATEVRLVHRRDRLSKASPIMADRLLAHPKVKPVWNSVIEEVIGDDEKGMTSVRVKNLETGAEEKIDAVGMFLAIGHTPNTKFLKGQVEVDAQGFIVLKDPFRTLTSVEGVYAAGDVADPTYKQAITAAGMGCKAALDAERWLAAKNIH
jgi:thioredoxin reductase (NADPH)